MAQKSNNKNNVSNSNKDRAGTNRSDNPGRSASGSSTKDSVAQFPDNRPARSGPGGE